MILKKVVFLLINNFLNENNILEKFQPGFRANHSTEIVCADANKDFFFLLVLSDLSAAFDTAEHEIFLNSPENWLEHTLQEVLGDIISKC